jgi:nicotinamide riboside transporter PnuC
MSQAKPPTGPLGQIFALVAGLILLVLGFMFSVMLLAVFVAVGLTLGAWFFWKTRHLRKAMREAAAMRNPPADGDVIEGEAVIVEEYRVGETPVLPDDTRKP